MFYPLFMPINTSGREPAYQGVEVDPSVLPWWSDVSEKAIFVAFAVMIAYLIFLIVRDRKYIDPEEHNNIRWRILDSTLVFLVILIIITVRSVCLDNWKAQNIDPETGKLKNQTVSSEQLTSEHEASEDYVSTIMKQILQNGEEVDRSTVLKYAAAQCDEIAVEDGETVFTFGDQKVTVSELYEQFELK